MTCTTSSHVQHARFFDIHFTERIMIHSIKKLLWHHLVWIESCNNNTLILCKWKLKDGSLNITELRRLKFYTALCKTHLQPSLRLLWLQVHYRCLRCLSGSWRVSPMQLIGGAYSVHRNTSICSWNTIYKVTLMSRMKWGLHVLRTYQ